MAHSEGTSPKECYEKRVRPGEKGAQTLNPCSLAQLRDKYGWDAPGRPYSQVMATGDIIYIGTELPKLLTDRDLIKQFALDLMRDLLPEEYVSGIKEQTCDITTEWGRKKKQLSVSVFDIELGEINRTVMVCGQLEREETTSAIFFMGDSRKNPLYTTGSGAQTGIREVMYLDDMLGSSESLVSRLEIYHSKTRATLDEIWEKQNKWIAERRAKESEAQKNYILFSKVKSEVITLARCLNEQLPNLEQFEKLRNTHQKIFDACQNEANIISFNELDVKALITDLKDMFKGLQMNPNKEFQENYNYVNDLLKGIIDASEPSGLPSFFSNKKSEKNETGGVDPNIKPKAK